ncbi:hypothetical protein PUN28_014320 [Cardiocondyla obscurior]|uniref:Secreted protein n=1 Tax=Cardiocondyla obscurior TaxID=286306 RepID=A0AAW2F2R8_9HYME
MCLLNFHYAIHSLPLALWLQFSSMQLSLCFGVRADGWDGGGERRSPLNRGEAEIRAPPRAVASIPSRLAPQPMPCPASCFFSIVCFLFFFAIDF